MRWVEAVVIGVALVLPAPKNIPCHIAKMQYTPLFSSVSSTRRIGKEPCRLIISRFMGSR